MVAMRKHRSRQRTANSEGVDRNGFETKEPFYDVRNHPNPSFKKEGKKITTEFEYSVTLNPGSYWRLRNKSILVLVD